MVGAATEAGWETILCADAKTALASAQKTFVQLAMVDLVDLDDQDSPTGQLSGGTGPDKQRLLEKLSAQHGTLLLVCGHEEDALEEIWTRQLGVWIYLPGGLETADAQTLCVEAQQITQKLAVPQSTGAGKTNEDSSAADTKDTQTKPAKKLRERA